MKKAIKIYIIFFKNNLKYIMLSKVNFMIGLAVFLLMQVISIFSIQFIFSDYSMEARQFALLSYGIYLCAKGVDHFFTDNLWTFSMNMVRDGSYSQYIVMPMNSLFLVLAEKVQFEAISEIIIGIILVVQNTTISTVNFVTIVWYIMIILSGSIFLFAIKLICASLAFYFQTSLSILDLIYNMTEFVKYPQAVYTAPIRSIFTYILPLFIIFNIDIQSYNLPLTVVINTILLTIGLVLWKNGEKLYDDAGGR